MDHVQPATQLFNAKAADGVSEIIPTAGFTHITLILFAATTPTLDVLLRGSAMETKPDLTAAAAADNIWSYISMQDQGSLADIIGSTGHQYAGTAGAALLRANVDALKWIALEIDNRSAGALTAYVVLTNEKLNNA